MTGVAGWFRRHLAFAITLAVVLVLFIGSVIFTIAFYRDKAAPGTTIANQPIGGQTKDQIVETIQNLVNNMRLSLTYGGKSATASSTDLGLNININKIAQEAAQTGQRNPFALLFDHKHFDLSGSYDKKKVNQFVTSNFPELTTDPKDAQVVYDKNQNKFVVQPGAIGKSVQLDSLYREIERLLSAPQLTNYEIATSDDKPTISDQAAQEAADQTNKSLAQSIQIINNGRTIWTIDPWTIADWVTFTAREPEPAGAAELGSTKLQQPIAQSGSYDISYNRDKIKGFVNDAVAGQLADKPVNQKAITNGNGQVLQVISAGRNGKVASNVDAVVTQIYDDISNGKSSQIELKSKEASYGTDATVAKDGHWIEYNLSTYEVRLWDGTNIAWSTNQTSQGKTSTPTVSGLFKVWHKNYNQCMPNPPSPTPLCNIHYVTYWHDDYAFHEAWWMSADRGNVQKGISHGCVNMYQADAKRVYDWSSIGTPVWVHY